MQFFSQTVSGLATILRHVLRIVATMVRQQRRQPAQGLVEYAIILVLIAVVVIGTVTTLGRRGSTVYTQIDCGLAGSYVTTTVANNQPVGHGGTNPSQGGARPNQGGSTSSGCVTQ